MTPNSTTMPELPSDRTALPPTLRLLCVSIQEPSWTALTLLLDQHGCREPQFRWCDSSLQALGALRHENYDCLIIDDSSETLRALALVEAVDADGGAEAVLVITPPGDDPHLAALCRYDCEVMVSTAGWQSRSLPEWIARTIERSQMLRENLRLTGVDQRRAIRDRDETDQLLEQQRRILREHAAARRLTPDRQLAATEGMVEGLDGLPGEVVAVYQDLLRSYVMMGAGSLAVEIRKLAQLLVVAGLSPTAALQVHLERVEELVRGLGTRSSRHVMSRADLLAMELMIEIGECYRQKSELRGLGDFGIDLLHEESLRQKAEGISPS